MRTRIAKRERIRAMSQRMTLKEIARAAKVSPATVSRAINKTGRVSPEIDRRIRAAMARLASTWKRPDKTCTVCFLLGNRPMLHPFHGQVLMGAQEFAAERESHILFYPFRYGATVQPDDIRLPILIERRGQVDGYIVGGMNSPNLLSLLTNIGVPFSVLGNNVFGHWQHDSFDVVWMDDITGAYESIQFLLRLGHRAIWFVGNGWLPTDRISQGYCRAMQGAGLEPQLIENDSAEEQESGYLATKSLLSRTGEVTAIFAASDGIAHGAIEAILAHGLRIPADISVLGFGDRPESVALTPSLTTVWGYPDQVGRRLAELVLTRIAEPGAPRQEIVLPTRLIKRNSCAEAPSPRSFPAKVEPRLAETPDGDMQGP